MSHAAPGLKHYVILPPTGLRTFFQASRGVGGPFLAGLARKAPVRVLDSIHADGARLIETTPETASGLTARQPGLRVVPVVYYRPAVVRYSVATSAGTA